MKNKIVVFGIGKFGENIAKQLMLLDEEVLAIDYSEERINYISQFVTQAIQADATDRRAFDALDLSHYDFAIISVGSIQASVLITMRCKEIGLKFVLSKAENELHKKILEKVGADKAVIPEQEVTFRLAHNLVSSDIIDYMELAGGLRIIEIIALDEWIGHTLADLNFKKKYAVNVIAIINTDGQINMLPTGEDMINTNDLLVTIGDKEAIEKIRKNYKK